mgnify:CR=1 FL=1
MKWLLRVLCFLGFHDSVIVNITHVHRGAKLILEGDCARCGRRVKQVINMKG